MSIDPSRVVARQNTSVVVRVDTPEVADADLPSNYAFDLDEVVGRIDVTIAPCPAGAGSRACQDWTITPRSDSVPGSYFVNVQTVGSRAGRATGSFRLNVVSDPAPDHGAAVHIAGSVHGGKLVLTADRKLFVVGRTDAGGAIRPVRVGYRLFPFPLDSIDPFQDPGFAPSTVTEFVSAPLPDDARWTAVSSNGGYSSPLLFAVRDDGTVWALAGDSPRIVSGLSNVRSVVTNRGIELPHLALLADGRVMEFGTTVRRVQHSDGTLSDLFVEALTPRPYCEERDRGYEVTCARELTEVRAMASDSSFPGYSLFLKRDGTVWGGSRGGVSRFADAPNPALAVATAGFDRTIYLVLSADGTVWKSAASGGETHGPFTEVTGLNEVIAIDPDSTQSDVINALRRDGTVWSWRLNDDGLPAQVSGLTNIVAIESGHAIQGYCPGGGGSLWRISAETQTAERLHGFGENCGGASRVAISASVTGQGRVVSVPAGIDCPGGLCRFFFPRDSRVELHSSPARGWIHQHWDPGCAERADLFRSDEYLITTPLSGDLNCTATFVEGGERRLDVQLEGGGTVRSSPEGIDCGSDCSQTYDLDAVVRLAATPALGYRFDRFAGHEDCSDGLLTMAGVRSCAARFVSLPAPAAPTGFSAAAESNAVLLRWDAVNGPVTRYSLERADGAGAFMPLIDRILGTVAEFRDGSAVNGARYSYRLIAHNLNGSSPAVTVTIGSLDPPAAVRTLAVRFANSGSGRVTSQPAGIDCSSTGGNNNCAQNFADGTVVQLVAEPAAGFRFDEWRGDADCIDGQLTMDANKGCEAVFVSSTASFVLQFNPANIIGAGGVETDDLRIVCPSGNCAATYLAGTLVRIRAVPAAGAMLEAWTGACASFPAQSPIQFVMTGDVSCGATFASAGP